VDFVCQILVIDAGLSDESYVVRVCVWLLTNLSSCALVIDETLALPVKEPGRNPKGFAQKVHATGVTTKSEPGAVATGLVRNLNQVFL
jgi:hypothetical protein